MAILTDKVGINVLLEGVDGAGKSTVANLLVDKFAKNGFEAIVVKAPDDRFRDFLSRNSFSRPGKVLLYATDMLESCKNIIVPHLREGKVVIQDRSIMSMFVYQRLLRTNGDDSESFVLRNILDRIGDLVRQTESGIRCAVLVALLDVPARVAMDRSAAHVKDEYETAELEEWVADSILEQSLQRYHMMTADCVPGTNNTDQTYTSQTNPDQTEGDA